MQRVADIMDAPGPLPDELAALLERARTLDPDAYDRLIELYGGRIFGFLLRMTGSREDAEDMLQEVFLRLVRMLPSYEHAGNFDGWLFRIAANLSRDRIRRLRRSPIAASLSHRSQDHADENGYDGWDQVDDSAPAPDAGMMRSEAIDRMQAALAELPAAEREVVLLRFYSTLSFAEIAETMGTPLGTALARSHRGLSKLRSIMETSA